MYSVTTIKDCYYYYLWVLTFELGSGHTNQVFNITQYCDFIALRQRQYCCRTSKYFKNISYLSS